MSKISTETSIENGNGFWAENNHQYLNVRYVDYGNIPRDIDLYGFTEDGELKSVIHADSARIEPAGTWLFKGVMRTSLTGQEVRTEHLDTLPWASFLRPHQVQLLILPPDSMPPIELYGYLRALKQQNHQGARLEQAFWSKIAIPLSMAAMVIVATPFVFGPPRARSGGQRITIGVAVGIVFTLAQQIIGLLGQLLELSPAISALAPAALLLGFAYCLSRRAMI